MADEIKTMQANQGMQTSVSQPAQVSESVSESSCPTWDSLGTNRDFPSFFNPGEDGKRNGVAVVFLTNGPRKETPNRFRPGSMDLWFEIEHEQVAYTWTINQFSLLIELKKHEPLAGKAFFIQLVPVDEEYRRLKPNYKGKDRYTVEPIDPRSVAGRSAPHPTSPAHVDGDGQMSAPVNA